MDFDKFDAMCKRPLEGVATGNMNFNAYESKAIVLPGSDCEPQYYQTVKYFSKIVEHLNTVLSW